MSQLRCLTIKAKEPSRVADFYREVFELKTISEDPELVRLSDGVFTLAFLKKSKEGSEGLHASEFQVEKLQSVQEKSEKGRQASPQSEAQVADSDHNLIDLTTKDFGVAPEKTRYAIRHIALYTADPKRLSNFYNAAFDMKEVAQTDRSSIFVSDGYFNLALLYQRVREEKTVSTISVSTSMTLRRSAIEPRRPALAAAPRDRAVSHLLKSASTTPKATASISQSRAGTRKAPKRQIHPR